MNGISDEHFHKWVPKQWRYRGYHQIIHVDHQGMFPTAPPRSPRSWAARTLHGGGYTFPALGWYFCAIGPDFGYTFAPHPSQKDETTTSNPNFRTGKWTPNPKNGDKVQVSKLLFGVTVYMCLHIYIYDNMKVIGDHIPKIFQLPSSQVDVRAMELLHGCREMSGRVDPWDSLKGDNSLVHDGQCFFPFHGEF